MALRFAATGWFVFPLRPRDKRPAAYFTDWERRATRDPERIYQWWHKAPYNIGIATGPSQLLVVDCDTGHGQEPPQQWAGARDGLDILEQLARTAGHMLPLTLQVGTPSGGSHLYFTAPELPVLRNTAGKIGWKIDTRGVGGYIVAPGSLRSEGYYTITHHAPVAPLPTWLVEALAPKRQLAPPKPAGQQGTHYLQAILRGEAQRITGAAPGARNNALNTAAFILGQLVAGGELTEEVAWYTLHAAAHKHVGIRGFTENEIFQTISSGLSAGRGYPRKLHH